MASIVPSQVVHFIDQLFPQAGTQKEGDKFVLYRGNSMQMAALLALIDRIPGELIDLDGAQYCEFLSCQAALHDTIKTWETQDKSLSYVSGLPRLNPITLIRRALAKCPDSHPAPSTPGLEFIPDPEYRASLRDDLSQTNKALLNGEWKAATVLAGSLVEALLLSQLHQSESTRISEAVLKLRTDGKLKGPEKALEEWHLSEYIEVALQLGLVTEDSAKQARLAKDFRNLIHPGREIRKNQSCNRGTALTAVAAVEHVIQDLIEMVKRELAKQPSK
jgi:hypothetical protein